MNTAGTGGDEESFLSTQIAKFGHQQSPKFPGHCHFNYLNQNPMHSIIHLTLCLLI